MKMWAVIFVFGISLTSVFTLPMETARGPCPKPETINNFDPTRLAGTWYDIKRYKNTILKGSCGTGTYTWYPNNSSYSFPYKMLEYPTNTLTLTELDVPNGKFHTRLNGIITPFDYWLLDTDYENYHVFYTCIELIPRFLNSQSVNIMSRQTTLSNEHLEKVVAGLKANKLDTTILVDVQQDNTVCGRN